MTSQAPPQADEKALGRPSVSAAGRIDVLDGLRGLSILLVLMNHWYRFGLVEAAPGVDDGPFVRRLFMSGQTGVILFFVISAFTLSLTTRKRASVEARPWLDFAIRRAFRILPPWWLAVAAYAAAFHLPARILPPYVFLTYGAGGSLFGGEWSLFVEETFYLFFPLFLAMGKTLVRAVAFTVALYLVRVVWLAIGWSHFPSVAGHQAILPLGQWYAFGLGMILLHVHERLPQGRRRIPLGTGVALLLCGRFLGERSWGLGDDLSALVLCAVFLLSLDGEGLLGRLVRARFMRTMGACCYSMYLFQILVLKTVAGPLMYAATVDTPLAQWPRWLQFFLSFPVFVLLCTGVGLLLRRTLELPFIALGGRVVAALERTAGRRRMAEGAAP